MISTLGYELGDKLKVKPGLILAPMSGVTCLPFRRLIKELNGEAVGMTVSEFISVEAMTRQVRRSLEMMRRHQSEEYFTIQIFGYDIERMGLAAQMVQDAGADSLDINCGCPAPKVVRKGGGCELMRNGDHLAKMLNKVRSVVSIPLTLKMRAGWDQDCVNATEIAHIAESEGVEALAVHGRTRTQMYRGEADWNIIASVVDSVKIPVVGSGDVVDYASAKHRAETGKVNALMIGRGAISNPFVFKEIMTAGEFKWRDNQNLIVSVLKRYIELLREECPDRIVIGRVKQIGSGMCKGLPWRRALLVTQSMEEVERLLDDPESALKVNMSKAAINNENFSVT
jgi:tRNA-dihydrouridine synthase B